MISLWHWILNFTGVNDGQNAFATHMYNFWSGFGGDLAEFVLLGALITIYRKYIRVNALMNNHLLDFIRHHKE
jgi:hypothetical protein